jgi:hypothetical protein
MSKDKLINIDSNLQSGSPSISSPDDPDGSYKVGPEPPVLPPGMEEQALRFSLPLAAIKWNKEEIFKLAEMYNKKFKVHKYIWSYESKDTGDKENNPHLHCYLILPIQKKSTKSDYITKVLYPFIRRDVDGRLMHRQEPEVIKLKSYKAYIIKDNLYITNYTDEELEEIIKIRDDIKANQKLRVEDKLLKIIQDKENKLIKDWEESTKEDKPGHPPGIGDLNDIYHLIIKIYCLEWKKAPPLNLCRNYAVYVGINMNNYHALRPQTIFY